MTLNRAAVVGPYAGISLPAPSFAFNDPDAVARWDDGPKMGAMLSELMEGLFFSTDPGQRRATLSFADLQATTLRRELLVSLRPPQQAGFHRQMDLVIAYADLRGDRAGEIMSQIHPPMAYWASVVGIQPHRHKKTLLLLLSLIHI